jgi:prepilin-type N-terminal cleavage/methylation domain-containing protein
MQQQQSAGSSAAGFSLVELLVAMAVTLVVMVIASTMVAGSFNIRARENQRSDALSDSQRALNFMTRDIANAGFGLRNNGIVAADSTGSAIRVRANLNAFSGQTTSDVVTDPDEDLEYTLISDGTNSYLVRLDVNTSNQSTILANRIDNFRIHYYASKVNYTPTPDNCDIDTGGVAEVGAQKGNARYIVLVLCVTLPQKGTPGSPGYQAPSKVQLVSDVALRNSDLTAY